MTENTLQNRNFCKTHEETCRKHNAEIPTEERSFLMFSENVTQNTLNKNRKRNMQQFKILLSYSSYKEICQTEINALCSNHATGNTDMHLLVTVTLKNR